MGFDFLMTAAIMVNAFASAEYTRSLKGMQGLLIACSNKEQMDFVLQKEGQRDFDFLKITSLPSHNIRLLVTANQVSNFKNQLESHGIKYEVYINDYQKVVENESKAQKEAELKGYLQPSYSFDYFPRYQVVKRYLSKMARKHESVTLFNIGKSFEGRITYGVKISRGGSRKRPAILIDAGIHGREWIAPPTALFTLSKLVQEKYRYLYKNVDWYIIPLVNPDGYEFSHTGDRLWMKTRSINEDVDPWDTMCVGVDANRNFDYKWRVSSNPCSSTYSGKEAFSEVESRNLRDFILSKNDSFIIYLSLNSFGKYILHPWGHTKNLPKKEPILRRIGKNAAKAIKKPYGTKYVVGSTARVLYRSYGGSEDWAAGVGGVDLVYTLELPEVDFVINPNRIKSIGAETFRGFIVFSEYAEKSYKCQ